MAQTKEQELWISWEKMNHRSSEQWNCMQMLHTEWESNILMRRHRLPDDKDNRREWKWVTLLKCTCQRRINLETFYMIDRKQVIVKVVTIVCVRETRSRVSLVNECTLKEAWNGHPCEDAICVRHYFSSCLTLPEEEQGRKKSDKFSFYFCTMQVHEKTIKQDEHRLIE